MLPPAPAAVSQASALGASPSSRRGELMLSFSSSLSLNCAAMSLLLSALAPAVRAAAMRGELSAVAAAAAAARPRALMRLPPQPATQGERLGVCAGGLGPPAARAGAVHAAAGAASPASPPAMLATGETEQAEA